MNGQGPEGALRVTLDRVQILDTKEPFFERHGEVRLRARISTGPGGGVVETVIPERGTLRVSAPGEILQLDLVVFEGRVADTLQVELSAVEVDTFSRDDQFEPYRRVHRREAGGLTGAFGPGDERIDPEDLSDWRVWYRIEEI